MFWRLFKCLDSLGESAFTNVITKTYGHNSLPPGSDLRLPQAIWQLGAKLVITTNYDSILKQANPKAKERCNSDVAELKTLLESPGDQVWHLHGHVDRKTELILAPSQYKKVYGDESHEAVIRLKNILDSYTVFFIGFGLRDPYVMEVLKYIARQFQGFSRTHYALLKQGEADEAELCAEFGIQVIEHSDHGEPLVEKLSEIKSTE